MTEGLPHKKGEKKLDFQEIRKSFQDMPRKSEGGNGAQKRAPAPSPDAVGANKKTTTPSTSERNTKTKTTNLNLAQLAGENSRCSRTATSYFDADWNTFAQQKDGSIQWIPEQIVGIGEDFHSQVDDGKVKTTVYRVRWSGYDRTGDTWEPITHLQGYAGMVKAFKESHEKDVERLAADRRREAESKEAHALKNAPKHTVLCMKGLTSPVCFTSPNGTALKNISTITYLSSTYMVA